MDILFIQMKSEYVKFTIILIFAFFFLFSIVARFRIRAYRDHLLYAFEAGKCNFFFFFCTILSNDLQMKMRTVPEMHTNILLNHKQMTTEWKKVWWIKAGKKEL